MSGERFVPNDVIFEAGRERAHHHRAEYVRENRTFLRQVALIVLMAQMGSFVPAAQRPDRAGGPHLHPHRRAG